MELEDKIVQDMKEALKSGDKIALETLRLLRSEMKNASIAKGKDLDDTEIISVLTKAAKKRKESVEMYRKGGREDLAKKEEQELAIISSYMPEKMSPGELESLVDQVIAQAGADSMRDMGKVMGMIMPRVKGRAEGGDIQALVKQKLS
jgi:uncharacterized protein YqeY